MLAQVQVKGSCGKRRSTVRGEGRVQGLVSQHHVKKREPRNLSRYRQQTVIAACEIAIELRVMEIGADAGARNFAPGEAVHLVESSMLIPRALAPAESRIKDH